jgi:proline iminopeptidase
MNTMPQTELFAEINGATLWIAESGAGKPVLLLPGGPGCCDYLGPVAAQIEGGAHVYRMEPRGCGRSDPAGPFDVETTLDDIEALRVHLGHERWIVGGHSQGAFFALAYALAHPERTEAILYLAGAGMQKDRNWSAAYHAGKDAGKEPEIAWDYPPNMEVNRIGNASTALYIQRPDLWREIADLDVPMLAISGENDIRPVWPVEQIVRLMPNARLEILPGALHDFWLTHPEEVGALLRPFLHDLAT